MRLLLLPVLLLLAACDAAQGFADARSASEVVDDNVIRAKLNTALITLPDGDLYVDVSSSVFKGRVMLTGSVNDAVAFDQAARIVNQVDGVGEIINELQIGEEGGFQATANDVTIETKLKSKLVQADLPSVNYRWKSVDGNVYLLGEAQDQAELDRVLAIVRGTAGVKRIITHVDIQA